MATLGSCRESVKFNDILPANPTEDYQLNESLISLTKEGGIRLSVCSAAIEVGKPAGCAYLISYTTETIHRYTKWIVCRLVPLQYNENNNMGMAWAI